jgi:hypothetical protein
VPIDRYVRAEEWQYYGAYHFFHLLWVIQFFFYFGYLVFAGATADWYFTPRNSSGSKKRGFGEGSLSHFPIIKSCCRSTKYHLGTVAVCSLIIAIVQFIRYTMMYIESQTKGEPPNKLQKALFVAIQCCLKCLECCLDKLNRNALIWTAIWVNTDMNISTNTLALTHLYAHIPTHIQTYTHRVTVSSPPPAPLSRYCGVISRAWPPSTSSAPRCSCCPKSRWPA